MPKILNFLQSYHPQHCQICHDLQSDLICQICQNIWFNAVNQIRSASDMNVNVNTQENLFKLSEVHRCPKCALILNIKHPWYKQKHEFCNDCDHTNFHFDDSFTLFDYIWPIQNLIPQIKSGHLKLLNTLAQILANHYIKYQSGVILDTNQTLNLISYVPSQTAKIAQRGYNPSDMIAKNIHQIFKKQYKHLYYLDCFQFKKNQSSQILSDIKMQKQLSQEARFLSLLDRYEIKPMFQEQMLKHHQNLKKNEEQDKLSVHLFLVDDVMTTGATLDALAHLAKQSAVDLANKMGLKIDLKVKNLVLARAVSFKFHQNNNDE